MLRAGTVASDSLRSVWEVFLRVWYINVVVLRSLVLCTVHRPRDVPRLGVGVSGAVLETAGCIARAERNGTRAETRFRLSPKRTSPFKSVGASVQSTAGSRGLRISLNNVGYTTFGGGVRVLATHSIRQFPLLFPSHASPCATRFRTSCTKDNLTAVGSSDERLINFKLCLVLPYIVITGGHQLATVR